MRACTAWGVSDGSWAWGQARCVKAFEGLSRGDVLYTCLPLYHTAGGGLGVMICLLQGPETSETSR